MSLYLYTCFREKSRESSILSFTNLSTYYVSVVLASLVPLYNIFCFGNVSQQQEPVDIQIVIMLLRTFVRYPIPPPPIPFWLHTLARLVCQRIVTGILHGDKSPMFVYGTVEASSCLQSDAEMLDLVDNILEKLSLSQVGLFLSFPYRKSVWRHLLHGKRVFQFLGCLH